MAEPWGVPSPLTASVPRQSRGQPGGVRPGARCARARACWRKCDFTPRPSAKHSWPSRAGATSGWLVTGCLPRHPLSFLFPPPRLLGSSANPTPRPIHQVSPKRRGQRDGGREEGSGARQKSCCHFLHLCDISKRFHPWFSVSVVSKMMMILASWLVCFELRK